MNALTQLRSLPHTVQLLLVNQLGVTVGFYLLMPFLAVYLYEDLHLAGAVVGLVLGVRMLTQQGFTVVGGAAADRFGCRPVIIIGCALRAVAFLLFAVFDNVAGLTLAAALSGIAGAVFSPATRAYLALAAGPQRLTAFSLFNVASSTGALAGPLLGGLLFLVDFRLVALAAAAVFGMLTLAQAAALPTCAPDAAGGSMWVNGRTVLRDRPFLAFSAACAGLFTLYTQLYLTLPLEATRATGLPWATSAVFAVSTVLTLLWQVRLTQAAARRLVPQVAIALGLLAASVAFVPAIIGSFLPPRADSLPPVLALLPVLLTTALLTLGLDVAQPFAQDLAAAFARPGLTGTYLGMFSMASGLSAAVGNTFVGWVTDLSIAWRVPWLSWAVLSAIGLISAIAVTGLRRQHLGRSEYVGTAVASNA